MAGAEVVGWEIDFGPELVRLLLSGEIDMSSAEHLEPAFDAVLQTAREVTIDLGGVTFLDGGGLQVLMELANRFVELGVSVSYGSTARSVDRYLGLTGTTLDSV